MNFNPRALGWTALPQRIRGMFNLNDPRWGRGDDKPSQEGQEGSTPSATPSGSGQSQPPHGNPSGSSSNRPGVQSGPPDLDELWRDLNRKLSQFLGGKNGGPSHKGPPNGSSPNGIPPVFRNLGVGVILGALLLIWMGTGFFIVQEGQQAVITQFGKYKATVGAGFNWRLPYPIQKHELVFVTQIRSVDIGRDNVIKATGLRESAMLTEDENIVEIKFAVQYRLNDARAYLFESKNPTEAVVQAAETAVREVVGKMKMDSALAEERDQIAPRVRALMQNILDRYKVGIEVVGINLQQGGVRPPEQVQAAFDDVLKAGQERERAKKAPQVTRDRMYLDAMQQIYTNVTKVVVDSKQGSNLMYLPLDKLMQVTSSPLAPSASTETNANGNPATVTPAPVAPPVDPRSRDSLRSRDRDNR
ncbi:MAG: FtsH protease activity modulator HflK [Betaproteobacteria bacterium]|nr:FtsH protease activity modulator HflK [Betaproteobacteria bacterium]